MKLSDSRKEKQQKKYSAYFLANRTKRISELKDVATQTKLDHIV